MLNLIKLFLARMAPLLVRIIFLLHSNIPRKEIEFVHLFQVFPDFNQECRRRNRIRGNVSINLAHQYSLD